MKIYLFLILFVISMFMPTFAVGATMVENNLIPIRAPYMKKDLFSDFQADIHYNFSKIEKVYVLDIITSSVGENTNIDKSLIYKLSEANIKDYMKCLIVPKEEADVILEIVFDDWKCEFDHQVPEKVTYEAYESYEGYKEEYDSFEESKYKMRKRIAKELGETPPKKPKPKEKKRVICASPFPGNKRVITSDDRYGKAKKIIKKEWFSSSREVIIPAYDIFVSSVTV